MENFWAQKIYTPLGFNRENILEDKKALDVGCGQRKLKGAVGLDINPKSEAEIIHDFNQIPWPLKENSFDLILLNQTLEHSHDVLKILGEVHRVAKSGSRVVIQVPYFRSLDASTDPTHRHFFTSRSLDFVIAGEKLSQAGYVDFQFKKIGFWYGWPHKSRNSFVGLFKKIIHRFPDFYDRFLSLILPMECLTWELEVIKQ